MRSNLDQALIFDSIIRSGRVGATRKILVGNYSVVRASAPAHFLDPNGSNYSVFLPAPRLGDTFFIFHVGASGTLLIRDNLSVLLVTVTAGGGFAAISSEDEWGILAGNVGAGAGLPLIRKATGTITVDSQTDDHILVGAGTATINLPAADDRAQGRSYLFVDDANDADSNAKTVTPDGSETIQGLNTVDLPLGGAIQIWPHPDGGKWYASKLF